MQGESVVVQITSPTNWLSSNIVLVTAIGPLMSSARAIPAPTKRTNERPASEVKVTLLITTPCEAGTCPGFRFSADGVGDESYTRGTQVAPLCLLTGLVK